MNAMNRKTRKAVEALEKKEALKNVVTPITGEDEQKSLEALRYQQHMATISSFQNQYVQKQRRRQELINEVIGIDNELSDVERQLTLFAAEAKDQVRTLMTRHSFTQVQINRLAKVPEILKQVNITSVLDMAGSPEEDPEPEADVVVGGNEPADESQDEEKQDAPVNDEAAEEEPAEDEPAEDAA